MRARHIIHTHTHTREEFQLKKIERHSVVVIILFLRKRKIMLKIATPLFFVFSRVFPEDFI